MPLTMAIDILVISVDDDLGSEMRYVADSRGWAVLQCPSLRQAMKQVIATKPKVVIVQVSESYDRALQLTRMLQTGWRRVPLIVTAQRHDDRFEREVRGAGASCYLPEADGLDRVDRYVSAILHPAAHAADGGDRITFAESEQEEPSQLNESSEGF